MEAKEVIKKWVGLVIPGMIFLFTVTMGVAQAQKKVTLTQWFSQGPKWEATFQEMGDEFRKQHPNIKIRFINQPHDILRKAVAAFATGTNPDILAEGTQRIAPIEAEYGVFEDLLPYVEKDPELRASFEALDPSTREISYLDGKLYAFPTSVQRLCYFVRKSWLDKFGKQPPRDWTELIDVAQAFTFNDPDGDGKDNTFGIGLLLGSDPENGCPLQFQLTSWASGAKYPILTPEGKPNFNNPMAVTTITFLRDLVQKYKVVPADALIWTFTQLYTATQARIIGMGRIGPWNVDSFDEWMNKDYIICPVPPVYSGIQGYQGNLPHHIALAKNCKNKKAGMEWLKFFISKWTQEKYYSERCLAARIDIDYTKLTDNPRKLYLAQPLPTQVEFSFLKNWRIAESIFAKHLHRVLCNPELDIPAELQAAEEELLKEIGE